jgi:arylformamidase
MVHGGGWARGDKKSAVVVENKVGRWVPQGVAVVSVGYPMIPKADPIEQAVEIGKALAWLDKNHTSLGLDMGSVALMGHSAGAHLVALVASDPSLAKQAGYAGSWRAVVALDGGVIDTVDTMEHRHFSWFDKAFGAQPDFLKKAFPLARMSRATAPILLVCSESRKESCRHSVSYKQRDEGFGGVARVLPVKLGHGDINKNLGLPGSYTEEVETFLRSQGMLK